MKYGLKESVLGDIINVFAKQAKIDKVLLNGSRAKGNYKKGSDIDLALFGEDLNLQDLHKILLELDQLYLPYEVDLVIFEKIKNEDLIGHINRIGIAIYEKVANRDNSYLDPVDLQ